MTQTDVKNGLQVMRLRVSWAWWVTYLYLPLTRFGIWLGVPLDPKIIAEDLSKGVRFEVI